MNKLDLTDVIDREIDKTAVVCGLSYSLNQTIDWIKNNRDTFILISCNDFDLQTNEYPDYWVWANTEPITNLTVRFSKNKKSIIVHADSVDTTSKIWINENFHTNTYIGYDQRHFNNQKCNACNNGCANFVDNRKTIQELLKEYTNYHALYSTGNTVAVHMLALSILLGCKKIYITGVDLNYKIGYYNSNFTNNDTFEPFLSNILNDFTIINESAKKIGVDIINLNDKSILSSIFKTELI